MNSLKKKVKERLGEHDTPRRRNILLIIIGQNGYRRCNTKRILSKLGVNAHGKKEIKEELNFLESNGILSSAMKGNVKEYHLA